MNIENELRKYILSLIVEVLEKGIDWAREEAENDDLVDDHEPMRAIDPYAPHFIKPLDHDPLKKQEPQVDPNQAAILEALATPRSNNEPTKLLLTEPLLTDELPEGWETMPGKTGFGVAFVPDRTGSIYIRKKYSKDALYSQVTRTYNAKTGIHKYEMDGTDGGSVKQVMERAGHLAAGPKSRPPGRLDTDQLPDDWELSPGSNFDSAGVMNGVEFIHVRPKGSSGNFIQVTRRHNTMSVELVYEMNGVEGKSVKEVLEKAEKETHTKDWESMNTKEGPEALPKGWTMDMEEWSCLDEQTGRWVNLLHDGIGNSYRILRKELDGVQSYASDSRVGWYPTIKEALGDLVKP